MTPHRRGPLAYWHSGGGIESRAGTLNRERAIQLFAFYAREALVGFANDDEDAALFCSRVSLELADAVIETAVWSRAAGEPVVRATGEFSQLWLRNAFIVKELLNYLDRREWS
jgi:hypothetical protein